MKTNPLVVVVVTIYSLVKLEENLSTCSTRTQSISFNFKVSRFTKLNLKIGSVQATVYTEAGKKKLVLARYAIC